MARELFPEGRLRLAQAYVGWLADAGVERGLIGPREAPRLWDRHVLNCALLTEVMPAPAAPAVTVADIGSGAGLPGIVLAIARPDLQMTLIEPLARRSAFLEEVVADLGLAHVEVTRARAEELHGERSFEVVTSRAVAPLSRLLMWSMPLVAPGGAMVAMKGRAVEDEMAAAAPQVRTLRRRLDCEPPEVLEVGERWQGQYADVSTTRVVRVARGRRGDIPLRGSARERKGRR